MTLAAPEGTRLHPEDGILGGLGPKPNWQEMHKRTLPSPFNLAFLTLKGMVLVGGW